MKFIECLIWMRDHGYDVLLWPARRTLGTLTRQTEEPIQSFIDSTTLEPTNDSAGDFFIEIAPNMRGDACAWVYEYPRPPQLGTDISIALENGTSAPPPDRSEWTYTDDECAWAPYYSWGMRSDDLVRPMGPGAWAAALGVGGQPAAIVVPATSE